MNIPLFAINAAETTAKRTAAATHSVIHRAFRFLFSGGFGGSIKLTEGASPIPAAMPVAGSKYGNDACGSCTAPFPHCPCTVNTPAGSASVNACPASGSVPVNACPASGSGAAASPPVFSSGIRFPASPVTGSKFSLIRFPSHLSLLFPKNRQFRHRQYIP